MSRVFNFVFSQNLKSVLFVVLHLGANNLIINSTILRTALSVISSCRSWCYLEGNCGSCSMTNEADIFVPLPLHPLYSHYFFIPADCRCCLREFSRSGFPGLPSLKARAPGSEPAKCHFPFDSGGDLFDSEGGLTVHCTHAAESAGRARGAPKPEFWARRPPVMPLTSEAFDLGERREMRCQVWPPLDWRKTMQIRVLHADRLAFELFDGT